MKGLEVEIRIQCYLRKNRDKVYRHKERHIGKQLQTNIQNHKIIILI